MFNIDKCKSKENKTGFTDWEQLVQERLSELLCLPIKSCNLMISGGAIPTDLWEWWDKGMTVEFTATSLRGWLEGKEWAFERISMFQETEKVYSGIG